MVDRKVPLNACQIPENADKMGRQCAPLFSLLAQAFNQAVQRARFGRGNQSFDNFDQAVFALLKRDGLGTVADTQDIAILANLVPPTAKTFGRLCFHAVASFVFGPFGVHDRIGWINDPGVFAAQAAPPNSDGAVLWDRLCAALELRELKSCLSPANKSL